jgi:hypothetical protein
MIRRLVGLIVVAAAVYAGWHVSVVWFHYQRFQDGVHETALFAEGKSDDALKSRVMELAGENDVPLDPDYITITRAAGRTTITASYAQVVSVLPGYTRRFDFDVK